MIDQQSTNVLQNLRASTGRRRIFINIHSNPEMVYLNTDMPGLATNVRIRYAHVDVDEANIKPYYQFQMGTQSVWTNTNIAHGAKPSSFQILAGNEKENCPVRFVSDHLPQNFQLAVYNPGENPSLVQFKQGGDGAILVLQYEFIAN